MPFVFYDLETSGTSPAFDQPLQFAAILTDDDLNPLDRIDIRCRLSPHILPAPRALLVTGVTPHMLTDPSLPSSFEFMQTIADLIDRWGPATWTGYNSISFDEEMLRQALFQHLHPSPYLTQMNGNDRLDILRLVYSVWELAPDALAWPTDEDGRHIYKLDRLAPANGFTHHDAHDALGDVEATIHIARLIRDRAPAVWEQALRNRSKHQVNDLLETGQPLRLVERFGAAPPRSYVGAYTGRNPTNPNAVGFLDLNQIDPADLALANDDELFEAVDATPKLIRTVTVNKVPNLFEIDAPDPVIADRAARLANMTELHARIGIAMSARFADREASVHVEEQIYAGFYSSADQRLLDRFQTASWEERPAILDQINDQRARQLGRRLLYLHRSDQLDSTVVDAMTTAIRQRWMSVDPDAPWMTFAAVEKQLAEIEAEGAMDAAGLATLRGYYVSLGMT
ncbi:exonuclease domain-containing protein [Nioella nitratireducens]|uniref:exonuclease domain-containing protein n=1 Tax=Nioella nitratireducens TaxID=1287720 RepID=UPI0008FD9518|nr:exonuclease domain-containing protein [Nioella nitratireducens]